MAKLADDARVVPSILDRLTASVGSVGVTKDDDVRVFRDAVMRDLESLLNARNTFVDLPQEYLEVSRSMLTFGLPDLSGFNTTHAVDRDRLRAAIETAVRLFEPRLTDVRVNFALTAPIDRSLRLRVEARLIVDPTPEPVSFDIVVPAQTSRYEISEPR